MEHIEKVLRFIKGKVGAASLTLPVIKNVEHRRMLRAIDETK
jgi:hypothetical protein